MRYKVNTTCYWHNRYYEKGEEVEVEAPDVPEHFTPILSISEKLEELSKRYSPDTAHDGAKSYASDAKEAAQGNEDAEEVETKPLDKMTNFELRALAKKNGIEFSKNATNTELIAAIRGE